jgi:asparagine synthase (glutamine-hydrolysing)
MCGIVGIVGTDREYQVESADIHRMCETIVHRGPDDEGIYAQGRVGLGMRRLSIIDLSTGHQPIHNEDRSIWIVFNGEIYNFLELRPDLERRGHKFYTNTDTEAIVHLYEEYGASCVEKLRGMFAFAIWDDRQQRLLLARDRLGKKPLHYAFSQGRFLFGSEIKTLLAVAPELSTVSSEGLLDYFYFGYIQDRHSAFTEIQKLAPGHLLEYANGKVQCRKYWELPACGTYEPASEKECIDDLEQRLSEAVRIRMISDVPLGALLSGGVDSSTVVALMARESSRPVKTFSIGFPNEDFNEAGHARLVAQQFGTEHHELVIDADFGETLDKLTHMMEEPFADDSMVPTYCVCALTRKHVTVALAGDGGDEFFGGYDRYMVDLRRRLVPGMPEWAGDFFRKNIFPRLPAEMYGRRFLFNMSLASRDRYLDSIAYLRLDSRDRPLFSSDFLVSAETLPSPLETFRASLNGAPATDRLSRLQYLDVMTYLPFDILTKVDRMSMAASLEVRAPLLDHVLAEWATKLSPKWKIRSGQQKYILKKLAERLGVPREALYRPKQGFAVPLVHWFRNELKQDLLGVLLEPKTLQRGYFSPVAVRQLMDEHLKGRRDRSAELWLLLVFELWHRNFLETLATGDSSQRAPKITSMKTCQTLPVTPQAGTEQ